MSLLAAISLYLLCFCFLLALAHVKYRIQVRDEALAVCRRNQMRHAREVFLQRQQALLASPTCS